jgi:hypothetical protein
VRGVELWELLGGITSNRGGSCRSYREAFWLYALPPRMRATHRRAAHATFSRVTAAAGHTQATDETTNDACPGALLEAEQVLIRNSRFVVQSRQEAGLTDIFA